MTSAQECPNSLLTGIENRRNVTYSLYQESEYFTVKVRECKVKRMRQIFDCGLHCHTSIGVLDGFPTPLQISAEACNEAFKTGKMTVEKGVEFPVRKEVNIQNHYFMIEWIHEDLTCGEGSYTSDDGRKWTAVALHQFEMFIQEREELFNVETKKMMKMPDTLAKDRYCWTGESLYIY